jgi:predicted CoA-substrate-specific enzyme activase
MDISAFGLAAARAATGASLAGRCAVFAKSDMIHLQQKGVPIDEIAYGLCLALARNFVSTILKGRQTPTPVGLAGGGALNPGMVRAFREVLGLDERSVIALPEAMFLGAIGAASLARESSTVTSLDAVLRAVTVVNNQPRVASILVAGDVVANAPASVFPTYPDGNFEAFLGIDVGSVSTDLALVARDGSVLDGVYLQTRGRPIEAMREGLHVLRNRHGERLHVVGMGSTGSGRHLAARLLGADLVKNEITAQLAGALHFFPDADAVFEIGGQDSKFIRLEGGRFADFNMNKVCAAGTGSFLEEQCEHLGLDVRTDFAPLAARSTCPSDLGARCTVFMEAELVNARRAGADLPDLAAGVADAVARNYLQKVVGQDPVGPNVVFQGGVASNAAVVRAFGRLLGRPVSVHPHNGISGAIGVALLTRDSIGDRPTTFKGFDSIGHHETRTFECHHCENRCDVTQVSVGGEHVHFGDTCERYTVRDYHSNSRDHGVPDLFAEREALWSASLADASRADCVRGTIGIPRASVFLEYLPFWAAFFGRLGFKVVVSASTSMRTLDLGTRHLPAETCLPIKLAFGHVAALRPLGADVVFLPSLVALEDSAGRAAYGCPYTQAVPFMVRAAMPDPILAPEVSLFGGFEVFASGMASTAEELGINPDEMEIAFEQARTAQEAFRIRLHNRGREVLESDFDRALIILGRPYNLSDPFLNLNLARHLARLGVIAIPQSFVSADHIDLESAGNDNLPWRFPREATRVALATAGDPRLDYVLVSNFGCGPDAFLQKHIESSLPDRRILVLEFDEHRGEAGMVTRLEAFLDEASQPGKRDAMPVQRSRASGPRLGADSHFAGRRIYVPLFSDHAYAFAGVARYLGAQAEVLPAPDATVMAAGEEAGSGKECHAFTMMLGDVVRLAQRHSDHSPASFFMPGTSIPCLLSQFADAFRLILEERGQRGLTILAPNTRQLMGLLGLGGAGQLWRGLVVVDALVRWLCGTRPYEIKPGSTDIVHRENLVDLVESLAIDDLPGYLGRALGRMETVAVDRRERRPVIGVAGDIYTRVNQSANLELWRRLESMGCEVWPAPFLIDNVEFGFSQELGLSLRSGRYQDALVAGLMMLRKNLKAWSIRRRFSPFLVRSVEPGYDEVLRLASPYVGPESQELLLLNVAKMVDFAQNGADGVINAMCLNCMVGTASASMISGIGRDHGGIPIVNMMFSGTETSTMRTKIETFVHQAREFKNSRLDVA